MAKFTKYHFIPRWAVAEFLGLSMSRTTSPGKDFIKWRDFWDLNDSLVRYLCTNSLGGHTDDDRFVRFMDVLGVTTYKIRTPAMEGGVSSIIYGVNENDYNTSNLPGPEEADCYFYFAGAAGGGGAGDCFNSGWAGAGGNAGQVYFNIRPTLSSLLSGGGFNLSIDTANNGQGGNGGAHDSKGGKGSDVTLRIGGSTIILKGGLGGGDNSSPNNPNTSQASTNAIGGKGEKPGGTYYYFSQNNTPVIDAMLYNGIINSADTASMVYWQFSPRELGQIFPIPGAGGYNSYAGGKSGRAAAISRMVSTNSSPYYTLVDLTNPDISKTFESLSCGGGGPDNDMINHGNPGTYGGGGGGGAFSSSHEFSSGGKGGDAWYCVGKTYYNKWVDFYQNLTI